MNLLDMMFKGGVIMWPILGCSLIAVYVVIERYLVLRRAQVDVSEFMRKLRSLFHRGEFSAVLTYCEEKDAPVANIIRRGLLKHGEGPEKVREAIENAGREEVFHLERRLPLLASVAGVAPMLGFLGTVTGMIAAFHAVEVAGGVVSPGDLAGGVWEALLTTAFGLIVGIPALAM
jgi:biopolymer transport protein ExbB